MSVILVKMSLGEQQASQWTMSLPGKSITLNSAKLDGLKMRLISYCVVATFMWPEVVAGGGGLLAKLEFVL